MKTALQELIDELKDYKRTTFSDKLVVTFWIVKAEKLLYKEKEQIINAANFGLEHFGDIAEEYYNQNYRQHGLDDEARQILDNL